MSFLPIRHTSLVQNTRAFTLLELMIVVSIIMTLMGLVLFPYNYYMQRAYVENSIDIVGQKWILAHKDIRNGKLYDVSTSAHKILVFKR
jgi:competence protein ComGF